ncbi:hypothetical protein BpHYR1_037561 [Brachionus plicatilis]|uniref:Uncharacterized protein n=1 Tax=Brachionus plicatilis TaxID=10195 RepID=A0A3M7Q2A0_BRAPC|nr:hypothetical protein BpHYR1_037561 [Brachionus plicatilis]
MKPKRSESIIFSLLDNFNFRKDFFRFNQFVLDSDKKKESFFWIYKLFALKLLKLSGLCSGRFFIESEMPSLMKKSSFNLLSD